MTMCFHLCMRTVCVSILTILVLGVLPSCVTSPTDDTADKASTPIPGATGGLSSLSAVTPDTYIPGQPMGSSVPGATPKMLQASSPEELMNMVDVGDLVFTDPDNPYADIKELDEAFSTQKERAKQWRQNYYEALRDARRSGKPILIWFHDSKYSPPSQQLSGEVLKNSNFEPWAKDNLICLCYDKSGDYRPSAKEIRTGSESVDSVQNRRKEYVKKAFEHFGVRGAPGVIILAPDGTRISSWHGYVSGNSQHVVERIRHDVSLANKQFETLKERLEKSGFRYWTGKNDTKIFASFVRYIPKTKTVWFKEFDGSQFKAELDKLSASDQALILEQHQSKKK